MIVEGDNVELEATSLAETLTRPPRGSDMPVDGDVAVAVGMRTGKDTGLASNPGWETGWLSSPLTRRVVVLVLRARPDAAVLRVGWFRVGPSARRHWDYGRRGGGFARPGVQLWGRYHRLLLHEHLPHLLAQVDYHLLFRYSPAGAVPVLFQLLLLTSSLPLVRHCRQYVPLPRVRLWSPGVRA